MLVRLTKGTFVRDYGPYTHIFNQTTRLDETYTDASNFLKFIKRTAGEIAEITHLVCSVYDENAKDEVSADFYKFIEHLRDVGFVAMGKTIQEIEDMDIGFTYDVEDPSTAVDLQEPSIENVDNDNHALLHGYFVQHPTPFSLHLDLTSECNERCVHCYVPRNKHHYIDSDQACMVMSQFRDMGGLQITLSGGECLLHPDFEKILRFSRDLDLSVSVLSNLTCLTDHYAQLFKDMNLSLVQVSLYSMDPLIHDSITRLNGSFSRTKKSIERLRALDVPLQISCPCMKQNYKGYRDVLDYAYSMKIKAYTDYIMMARSDGTTDNLSNRLSLEESKELMRTIMEHELEMRKNLSDGIETLAPDKLADQPLCGVGLDAISLGADGNYYACSGFQGYPLGNCLEHSLREVWEDSPRIKYLRGLRKRDFPKCTSCPDSAFCAMCLVRNFNETGNMLNVSKHFCDVARINHELVDEYKKNYETSPSRKVY